MNLHKFKVWDKQEKCWVPEPVMITGDGVLHIEVADREWTVPADKDRFVVCRSTGCNDKNGKEIFQDDILKSEKDSDFYTVVWNQEEARFNGENEFMFIAADFWHERYESIGNIHENQELLK